MERPVERGGFNRLDGGSDPDEVEVEVAEEAEVKEAMESTTSLIWAGDSSGGVDGSLLANSALANGTRNVALMFCAIHTPSSFSKTAWMMRTSSSKATTLPNAAWAWD